ncbi:protein FAM98A-like [Petromyzon marinus]|uniref:Protein FAM98A-like n=1 Tax=Petromyzon marinus TaxID=7757 RepID=A0AAJ7TNH2_PETMA|nr:protein FAM98A-like [Petromyzon marinus]
MELTALGGDAGDAIRDLGYALPAGGVQDVCQLADGGPASPDFTQLCAWLTNQLRAVSPLEESLTPTSDPEEAETFQLEVSGLMAELCCPYPALTTGDATKRLSSAQPCLQLLLFLATELQAARVLRARQASQQAPPAQGELSVELGAICCCLELGEQPVADDSACIFTPIQDKVVQVLGKLPGATMEKPLLQAELSPPQWERLENINQVMLSEYELRRKMLLKRLDVTVQSFGWSEKAQTHVDSVARAYVPKRAALSPRPSVSLAHVLAARADLSRIVKTTGGDVRAHTACSINKVLMGRVPDRGGRPREMGPPAPDMPFWQKRQNDPRGGRGRGGGGGWQGGSRGGQGGGQGGWQGGGYSGGRGDWGGGGRGGRRGQGKW